MLSDPSLGVEKLRDFIVALREGSTRKEEASQALNAHAERTFPSRWTPRPPRRKRVKNLPSKKLIRRACYANIQRLYNIRRKDAAVTVQDG